MKAQVTIITATPSERDADAGQEDAADRPVRREGHRPRRRGVGIRADLPVVVGRLEEGAEQDQTAEERDQAPDQEVPTELVSVCR